MKLTHHRILLLTAVILSAALNLFAQTEREKGIEFFKNGNYSEAIRYLDQASKQKAYKNDAEIWNYIGLSYINQNKEKDGRKAFEKAVKYAPQSSVYRANLAYAHLLNRKMDKAQSEINKAIQIDPKNANAYYIRGTANLWEDKNERAVSDAELAISLDQKLTAAYVLHSDGLLNSFGNLWNEQSKPRENLNLLERADVSLKKCLNACPQDASLKTVSERADAINAFLNYFKRTKAPNERTETDNQNITPLLITSKPKPRYTDEARRAGEEGNIRIAVMFGADGKIKYLLPIKSLRYGLTEQALITARGMTFEPQKESGKPVSVVKIVVFTFDIY